MSVIIAVAEADYPHLPHQLRALDAQRTDEAFEVIVADDGGCLDLPSSLAGNARVVAAQAGSGAAYARNVGVADSSGELLLFCDADDLVSPEWVDAHVRALRDFPFTTGPVRSLPIAELQGAAPDWSSPNFRLRPLGHEGVPVADTCNTGIRRDRFVEIGGFDERYLRSQDVALSLALRRCEIEPRFVPDAKVLSARGKRPLRRSIKVRFQRGRSRVMLAREFGLPECPATLLPRLGFRLLREALRPREAEWGRRVAKVTAELTGVTCQLALPTARRH